MRPHAWVVATVLSLTLTVMWLDECAASPSSLSSSEVCLSQLGDRVQSILSQPEYARCSIGMLAEGRFMYVPALSVVVIAVLKRGVVVRVGVSVLCVSHTCMHDSHAHTSALYVIYL
jgi:hypothetical protein